MYIYTLTAVKNALYCFKYFSALVKDAYRNGSHVMDSSSLKIINKSTEIIEKSKPFIAEKDQWGKCIYYKLQLYINN